MRLVVGISGASGVILGYRLLQALTLCPACEVHLVISEGGKKLFELSGIQLDEVTKLAAYHYADTALGATIASGSFVTDGMVIVPCSMKTLAAVAAGYAANLLARAADVCLKENRRVVLVPREMPLGKLHLRNLSTAADLGCTIIPPVLTFYNAPQTIDDQIDHIIGKILMQFGLGYQEFKPWQGEKRDGIQ